MNKEFEDYKHGKNHDLYEMMLYSSLRTVHKSIIESYFQTMFEEGQKVGRNYDKWIPVAERLPTEKDGFDVKKIVDKHDNLSGYCFGVLAKDDNDFIYKAIVKQDLENEETRIIDINGSPLVNSNINIIAWQPLSEV